MAKIEYQKMSTNELFELGCQLANRDRLGSLIVGLRTFNSFFGTSPEICQRVWDLLSDYRPRNAKPVHLLWMLFFLKSYNTDVICDSVAGVDGKTFRKWVWFYIKLISEEIHLVI